MDMGKNFGMVTGKVNHIKVVILFLILWYINVARCQWLLEMVILDIVVLSNIMYHNELVGIEVNNQYGENRCVPSLF